jgi:hypothetical protein
VKRKFKCPDELIDHGLWSPILSLPQSFPKEGPLETKLVLVMSILKTTLIFQFLFFFFFALKNVYSYTPQKKKKKDYIREGLLLRASSNLI